MIQTEALGPHFGAEILSWSLSQADDQAVQAELCDLLSRHRVLALRLGDASLDPEFFLKFAASFGELEPFFLSAYSHATHPQIYVLSNVRKDGQPIGRDGAGFHWHTDNSFVAEPSAATLLQAVEVPAEGGDTLFVDAVRAYQLLPESLKRKIDGKKAIHRYQKKEFAFTAQRDLSAQERRKIDDLIALRQREEAATAPSASAQASNKVPQQSHPLVRRHPKTGEKALYLNQEMMVGIEGMPDEEALPLLKEVCELATPSQEIFRYRWRRGDIVIWDNAATFHTATYTAPELPRTLHRLTVAGGRPL
ncbi:TauD/TfdA dioxygenase family protein [Rhodovibrionaceae bacterium A322]